MVVVDVDSKMEDREPEWKRGSSARAVRKWFTDDAKSAECMHCNTVPWCSRYSCDDQSTEKVWEHQGTSQLLCEFPHTHERHD